MSSWKRYLILFFAYLIYSAFAYILHILQLIILLLSFKQLENYFFYANIDFFHYQQHHSTTLKILKRTNCKWMQEILTEAIEIPIISSSGKFCRLEENHLQCGHFLSKVAESGKGIFLWILPKFQKNYFFEHERTFLIEIC